METPGNYHTAGINMIFDIGDLKPSLMTFTACFFFAFEESQYLMTTWSGPYFDLRFTVSDLPIGIRSRPDIVKRNMNPNYIRFIK